MGIRNGRKSVDLEVFVRADLGDCLDRAPICERGLSIVEILICNMLQMIVIDVGDTLGNLGAGNTAVQV